MGPRLLSIAFLFLTILSATFASTKAAKQDAQAVLILSQSLATMTVSAPVIQDTVTQATMKFVDGTSATLNVETKGLTETRIHRAHCRKIGL